MHKIYSTTFINYETLRIYTQSGMTHKKIKMSIKVQNVLNENEAVFGKLVWPGM